MGDWAYSSTHWIGGWLDTRASLDTVAKRKNSSPGHPVRRPVTTLPDLFVSKIKPPAMEIFNQLLAVLFHDRVLDNSENFTFVGHLTTSSNFTIYTCKILD
jgi:hypothetical protein